VTFNNARPRVPAPDAPLKHVIEEYRHVDQKVTCVCGWEGSSATVFGAPSPWTQHVRDSKGGRR
jgi:hypothetical protein